MATAQEMQFRVELNEPLVTQTMLGVLQQGDAKANVIRIAVYDGGMHTPAALEGNEVSGYFQREDGERVLLEGSISGNVVSVVLNENCYAISGSYGAFVRLTNKQNGAKRTILRIAGQVESEGGGPIIDPGNRIPSIDDVIAQLAKMEEAIEKAENAANNVGDAAKEAQSAATTANNAASTANEAAGNANNATTNANNATARANNAAAALEAAPVPTGTVVTYQAGTSATTPPTGTWLENPPTVPQGQYLWTRMVQSFTNGDPVTIYSVARQGMDGSGSVRSVCGVEPDPDGNVPLTPDKAGALPAGGTAVDAAKLGGKEPSAYLDVRDLTADELTAMDTAARAALYADGARVLKVTNGETVVLLTLNAEGATQWAGGEIPRNLLDNSDFTNPVNQRGQTSYTGAVYGIDRWKSGDAAISVTVADGYITVSTTKQYSFLLQKVRGVAGKPVTFAVHKKSDEAMSIRVYDSAISTKYVETNAEAGEGIVLCTTTIPEDVDEIALLIYPGLTASGGSTDLYWAALYEGSYTADTLPPYVPKENELWNCMKREVMLTASNGTQIFAIAKAWNTTSARAVFFLPVPMAEGTPTITFKNIRYLQLTVSGAYTTLVPTTATVVRTSGNVVEVQFTVSGAIAGETGFICANDTADAYIEFNKDL